MLDEAARAQRLDEIARAGSRRALRPRLAAAHPLCADPARRRRAPAHPHRPSHPDGRLVAAGAGARTAHALCAQAPGRYRAMTATQPRRCRASTPYRDYLAWIAGRTAPQPTPPGGRRWPDWRSRPIWRRASARRAPAVPEQISLALSEELTAALTRQARAQGLTLNSYHPGRLGHPARPADRPRRRGVRRHGGGPAAGDCRHRDHGGAVHQHPAAARPAAARQAARRRCSATCRTRQSRLMAHQHLGLAEIQGLAGLGRTVRHADGVRELSGRRRPALAAEAAGLRLTGISGHDATHYPLSLLAAPGERLRLRLDYRADLFERASRRRPSRERLDRLLTAAAAEPDPRRSAASTFSRPTSAAPSSPTWNDTARPIPDATIPELFAAQAARTPDAIALVCEDETLSYRELDQRANQLAHHLRSLGAGPETIVGLCVERSFDMVIALLGILKAGAAYLPLDPDYPARAPRLHARRRRRAASSSRSPRCANGCPPTTPASSTSTPTAPPSHSQPATAPPGRIDPAHHRLRHLHLGLHQDNQKASPSRMRGFANHMRWMADALSDQTGRDIVLGRTAISFDAAAVGDLAAAGRPAPRSASLRPRRCAIPASSPDVSSSQSITIAQFVPSLLEPMLAAAPSDALHTSQAVVCGGEALSGSLARDAVTTLQRAGWSISTGRPRPRSRSRRGRSPTTPICPNNRCRPLRSVGRSGTRGFTCWMTVCSLFRLV